MDNRYNHHNRRKYSLTVHIVLVTKHHKQLLKGTIADDVKQKIFDICDSNGWDIIAMETDKDHIHFLISYDVTNRICDIVKTIKQTTTYYLWKKYPNFLSKHDWKKKIFWSDGYFACSIDKVSSATIQIILRAKVNGYKSTRLLPSPKGSGFPPMTNKRIFL